MSTPTLPDNPTPADLETVARWLDPSTDSWRHTIAARLSNSIQTVRAWCNPNNPRDMPESSVAHLRAVIELESVRRALLT